MIVGIGGNLLEWCERVSMALTPEEQARKIIDEALHHAGWDVQDMNHVNVHDLFPY
jgi:hypothetical protein